MQGLLVQKQQNVFFEFFLVPRLFLQRRNVRKKAAISESCECHAAAVSSDAVSIVCIYIYVHPRAYVMEVGCAVGETCRPVWGSGASIISR
jgi:hypothetical protein